MTLSWEESWDKLDWKSTTDEELVRQVKEMLANGADVNAKGVFGRTALMVAAWNGKTDTVKALVEAGADVNAKNNDGWTALMAAAEYDRTDTVKALAEAGADVNAKDNDGWTALMKVVRYGNTDTVKALVEADADVNAKKDGWTALMAAAAYGYTNTVKALVEAGADVNAKGAWGKTALMKAARNDQTDTVKALVEAGADVNAENSDGETALDFIKDENLRKEVIKIAEEYKKNHSNNEVPEQSIQEPAAEKPKEEAIYKINLENRKPGKTKTREEIRAEIEAHKKAIQELESSLQKGTPERKALAAKLREIHDEYPTPEAIKKAVENNLKVKKLREAVEKS